MRTLGNLAKITLLMIKHVISRFSRFLYWNLRLAQSSLGHGVKIHFPVIIEGNGLLTIGPGAELMKRVTIGLSAGSSVVIGGWLKNSPRNEYPCRKRYDHSVGSEMFCFKSFSST